MPVIKGAMCCSVVLEINPPLIGWEAVFCQEKVVLVIVRTYTAALESITVIIDPCLPGLSQLHRADPDGWCQRLVYERALKLPHAVL